MKDTISLSKPLREKAAKVARKLRISRGRLYSRAVAEYVARHDADRLKTSYDKLCEEVDTRPDPALQEAIRRTLVKVEW